MAARQWPDKGLAGIRIDPTVLAERTVPAGCSRRARAFAAMLLGGLAGIGSVWSDRAFAGVIREESLLDSGPENPVVLSERPKGVKGFSGDQVQKLAELRSWLQSRKHLHAAYAGVGRMPPKRLDLSVYPNQQLLTPLGQRYSAGFADRRAAEETETRVLRIDRAPDGRIRARYVFEDGGTAESDDTITELGNGSRPVKVLPSRAGRLARAYVSEPPDQRIAPRLEFELPDRRR